MSEKPAAVPAGSVHEEYMREALRLAHEAYDDGEVPVGAVVVRKGEIVGTGRNRREKAKNALCHAELEAIDNACRRLGGWRLWECELYVTLEPCPMCAGAIVNARIPQVYFGAYDAKNGCCGSVADILQLDFGFHPACTGGVLESECSALLSEFFKRLRRSRESS
jgi:tRNA(adenine34) deaminase